MSTFTFPVIFGQRGLATTQQLLEAGASLSQLQHLVRSGRRILRTVYSPRPGPLTGGDLLVAASLWAGPRSVLTGLHALQVHGFAYDHEFPITSFLVPNTARARVRAGGFETVRTKRLPAPVLRDDLRIAPVERALADANRLRQLSDRHLRGVAMAILQNRRTSADRLASEIQYGRPNATGGMVEAVVDFRRGSWSVAEAELAVLVREHPDLPRMVQNPRLVTAGGKRIGTPDGYFPDAGVVVQVHSRKYHDGFTDTGGDKFASTMEKDLDYQTFGIVVVPVAPTTLRDTPGTFIGKLASVVLPRLGWQSDDVLIA